MSGTILFYIGVLVPAVITVVLFGVFLWCLYRMRVRRKIMTKRYAPHAKGWPGQKEMSPPPPPPPPISSMPWEMRGRITYDIDYSNKLQTGNPTHTLPTHCETTFNTTEIDNIGDLSSRRQDSGISELSEIQTNKRIGKRPYSQASTDSDDSGFRSSRSAHYLQNKCDTNGIYQDMPLLKSLSLNSRREETDRSPMSYTENTHGASDYLPPRVHHVHHAFHPYYGDLTDLPETDLGTSAMYACASSSSPHCSRAEFPQLEYTPMASQGFINLSGMSGQIMTTTTTTTTAMVHTIGEENDQQVYSVV